MVVQWLRLCASTAGGMGSIPGQETMILHVAWPKNPKKQTKKPKTNQTSAKYKNGIWIFSDMQRPGSLPPTQPF